MPEYLVNKQAQANGDHEVHTKTCSYRPTPDNQLYLGKFDSCHPAVEAAKRFYALADGCAHCCPACNRR